MACRCEWKALVLSPGLEVAGIRAIEQLGRYFATPIASRFFHVRPEPSDDGGTRTRETPVETLGAANRLDLSFAPPNEADAPAARGPEAGLFDGQLDGEDGDRLLVETAMPPSGDAPPAVWLVLELDADRWGGIEGVAAPILAWCREELTEGRILGARFATKGGATMPGPQPPLAGDALILCVEIKGVEREYGSLDRYVAAFDEHEIFERVVMVTRCLDGDLRMRRRRLLDSNGALARIARPRKTLWIPPIPPPLGVALERPDRPALRLAKTIEPGPVVEYSCSLSATQHVHPAEIASLQGLVSRSETLPDGRHAAGVTVVFDDEETGKREMRPLKDVGVKVLVKDATTGATTELLE